MQKLFLTPLAPHLLLTSLYIWSSHTQCNEFSFSLHISKAMLFQGPIFFFFFFPTPPPKISFTQIRKAQKWKSTMLPKYVVMSTIRGTSIQGRSRTTSASYLSPFSKRDNNSVRNAIPLACECSMWCKIRYKPKLVNRKQQASKLLASILLI